MRIKFVSVAILLLALVIAFPTFQGCSAIASYLIYEWIDDEFGDDDEPDYPNITRIAIDREEIHVGESVLLEVEADDDVDSASEMEYFWVASSGTIVDPTNRITVWIAPDNPGTVTISVIVKDTDENDDSITFDLEVLE